MEDITEKKKYLMQYRNSVDRIADMYRKLERAQAARLGTSCGMDGMPHASSPGDRMGEGLERVEDAREQLQQAYQQAKRARKRVLDAICTVDGLERSVLMQRYITGFTMEGIANSLHKSLRRVQQIHRQALSNIKIEGR